MGEKSSLDRKKIKKSIDKLLKKCYNNNVNKTNKKKKVEVSVMAEKKITKKEMFAMLLEVEGVKGNAEMEAFIRHEIELLEKKSSKSGSTKTQKENEEIKAKLVEALAEVGKAVTITEFQKASEYASMFSNQKISALFKQLEGTQVEKTVEKGKSYFSVIA